MEKFIDVIEKAQIRKAQELPPMSIAELFRSLYGGRLEKYKIDTKEYIRLIFVEICRRDRELELAKARLRRQMKENDRLRQVSINGYVNRREK